MAGSKKGSMEVIVKKMHQRTHQFYVSKIKELIFLCYEIGTR